MSSSLCASRLKEDPGRSSVCARGGAVSCFGSDRRLEDDGLGPRGYKNPKRKPTGITKEELLEVCKRETVEPDSKDVDRVLGLGSSSGTASRMMLTREDREAAKLGLAVFTHHKFDDSSKSSSQKRKSEPHSGEPETLRFEGQKRHKKQKNSKKKKKEKRKKHKNRTKSPPRVSSHRDRKYHSSSDQKTTA
ncbi:hypothetical protein chiPu_0009533 [Chiloscyllium punctatum]|uniref:Uncharacterized protein n=1 Tax=Chiloscyllium punctatum TaxID=137246 RepID=A0A401SL18_CHIPU|nr:hypothetical protein [Chiloscyllium punctatum]